MAERLRKFAAEQLMISLSVGSAVSVAGSKTYAQIFSENKELWIWSASPLDFERPEYWEKLCTEFLDKPDRLLVYFVPTLETADRLALRFENELLGREYDADGKSLNDAEGFGATVFIIVTNLAAATPYVILTNPGSANLTVEGTPPACWVMGKQAQDMFEVSSRYADQLIQKARAAGLGVGRNMENFFPLGQPLKGPGIGIPFRSYPNVDHLIGIRMEHSVGMFDGEPVDERRIDGEPSDGKPDDDEDAGPAQHPLKFYPAFIRAYRKKASEKSKKRPPTTMKKQFFKF
jgi:hypothetical protein